MNDWYEACLIEVQAFVDSLADADKRVVRYDSDLVAALTGLLHAQAIQLQAWRHLATAGEYLEQLTQ